MLHEFIQLNRDTIIGRCRAKVAARSIPPPSEAEINHGVPLFEDECGGLPDADPTALFPSFEQRAADRSGLGIGLAFSRWGAEASGGRLYARNLPGTGCIFTVDLPRLPVPHPALP